MDEDTAYPEPPWFRKGRTGGCNGLGPIIIPVQHTNFDKRRHARLKGSR